MVSLDRLRRLRAKILPSLDSIDAKPPIVGNLIVLVGIARTFAVGDAERSAVVVRFSLSYDAVSLGACLTFVAIVLSGINVDPVSGGSHS